VFEAELVDIEARPPDDQVDALLAGMSRPAASTTSNLPDRLRKFEDEGDRLEGLCCREGAGVRCCSLVEPTVDVSPPQASHTEVSPVLGFAARASPSLSLSPLRELGRPEPDQLVWRARLT
jgi:hypothetical protein